jgi:hypothetical protein
VKKKSDALEDNNQREPAADSVKVEHAQLGGLHYNIQIHLPATKDIEVFNAIFKSLKEHLFG